MHIALCLQSSTRYFRKTLAVEYSYDGAENRSARNIPQFDEYICTFLSACSTTCKRSAHVLFRDEHTDRLGSRYSRIDVTVQGTSRDRGVSYLSVIRPPVGRCPLQQWIGRPRHCYLEN